MQSNEIHCVVDTLHKVLEVVNDIIMEDFNLTCHDVQIQSWSLSADAESSVVLQFILFQKCFYSRACVHLNKRH